MINKSKRNNVCFLIISIVLVIFIPFGYERKENFNVYSGKENLKEIYGFPFDWLHLYPNSGFSFLWIGFIVNIIFFYYGLKILTRIYKKVVSYLRFSSKY